MRSHHTGQPIPVTVTPTSRQATARRLAAARVLAGRPSLLWLAQQTGMSYMHLRGVANANEPMTSTDCRDLAAVLDVPAAWLRDGCSSTGVAA